MQFIEFKKEHFIHDEKTGNYSLEIPKDEIGFGDVRLQKKQDDGSLAKIDAEIIDDLKQIKIILESPQDIRVNF
ncbi:hypothetical protein [Chryseobacterium chendengshani]|uniref:hypothetical protein n=1 Tax=unclassified Chryseobacterium TaxID=2593645 RepID=UPI001C642C4D|nr:MULTISPECIES: hypothetical protein [unclassified Chryseobacterium]MBW7674809.1 hypothetical protein [Chryseobacterium sp. LJ756]MBW8523646.1 hypothetical protein [Chryseobacterium sp. LJ668]QYK15928.1 hypothetical protein K0U91_12780 [Chryseobacterium sp. LJ668]